MLFNGWYVISCFMLFVPEDELLLQINTALNLEGFMHYKCFFSYPTLFLLDHLCQPLLCSSKLNSSLRPLKIILLLFSNVFAKSMPLSTQVGKQVLVHSMVLVRFHNSDSFLRLSVMRVNTAAAKYWTSISHRKPQSIIIATSSFKVILP